MLAWLHQKNIFAILVNCWLVYGVNRHFQQYFSYIKDLYSRTINPWLYRGGHFYWWEKPEKTSCVLLYFFFWPLCCLFFFDIRILIAPLVSSNSFCVTFTDIRIFFIHVITCTSTSTLVIRKESSDSSHKCIILDVIHHVLIKNICTCAV